MMWLLMLAGCIDASDWDLRQPHWVDVAMMGSEAGDSTAACAVRDDGTVRCWGAFGEEAQELTQIAAVQMHGGNACFHEEGGGVICLGPAFDDDAVYEPGPFDGFDLSGSGACGWSDEGVSCWSTDLFDERLAALPEEQERVAILGGHLCSWDASGRLGCMEWVDEAPVHVAIPSLEGVRVVDMVKNDGSYAHACALSDEGDVWCSPVASLPGADRWNFEQVEGRLVQGDVKHILGESRYLCGVNPDGVLACLGDVSDEVPPAPDGRYAKVVMAGYLVENILALTEDGYLVEWSNFQLQ